MPRRSASAITYAFIGLFTSFVSGATLSSNASCTAQNLGEAVILGANQSQTVAGTGNASCNINDPFFGQATASASAMAVGRRRYWMCMRQPRRPALAQRRPPHRRTLAWDWAITRLR